MAHKKRIIFCTNQKKKGDGCGDKTGNAGFDFAKKYLKNTEDFDLHKIKIKKSGCLGLCSSGPACTIYPSELSYTYSNDKDIKEVIDKALLKDKKVKHLKIK